MISDKDQLLVNQDLYRIDALCDELEHAWKSGAQPRIEDYLAFLSKDLWSLALPELLKVEVEHKLIRSEPITAAEYLARFGEYERQVLDCLNEQNAKLPEFSKDAPHSDTTTFFRDDTSPFEPSTSVQPSIFSRYEVLEELGCGGMGVVYKGVHRNLGHYVAIKVCKPKQNVERFKREGRLLATLKSPHTVRVHDFEVLPDGKAILVMELIDGKDLGRILVENEGPIAESRVLSWMRQVCEGMNTAAAQGIVHRDLKPSNILVDSQDQAHVVDFGLARSTEIEHQLTNCGGFMGTEHYMAPEQAEDPHGVDTRADIYSFGATFYHLLTGEPPFQGATPFSILFKHKSEPLISPKARNPNISARVSDCLERCLAKTPNQRFASFGELQDALQEVPWSSSPWESFQHDVNGHLANYRSRRGIYLQGEFNDLTTPDEYHFPDNRRITIGFGNLANQQADALVSSDDGWLTMSGGVSAALASRAGPVVKKEARRFAPVRAGRAVVTSAGNLPARFIFHAVMIGMQEYEWIFPSRDVIFEAMESCFYHADTLGLASIAFPLLGTGVGKIPRETCLDAMMHYLNYKFNHGVTSVRVAHVLLASRAAERMQRGSKLFPGFTA